MILHGDCLNLLPTIPYGSAALIAADPPFNIGLNYNTYNDKIHRNVYSAWLEQWLSKCYFALHPHGSIYVCQGDEYAAETKLALDTVGFHFRNWIVWHYTFGQNQRKKFSRCHTHIFYYTKHPTKFTFNASAVKVPSARQTTYGDKRAKAGGKVLDDVWTDSRVCGTFKERVLVNGKSYATQMPESIMERIIRVSSNPGQLVIDPFGGTCTTAAVAKRLGRRYWSCDVDKACVKAGINRVNKL